MSINKPRFRPNKKTPLLRPIAILTAIAGLALGINEGIDAVVNRHYNEEKKEDVINTVHALVAKLLDCKGQVDKEYPPTCECTDTKKDGLLGGRNCVFYSGELYTDDSTNRIREIAIYELDSERAGFMERLQTGDFSEIVRRARLIETEIEIKTFFNNSPRQTNLLMSNDITFNVREPKTPNGLGKCSIDAQLDGTRYEGIDCNSSGLIDFFNESLTKIFNTYPAKAANAPDQRKYTTDRQKRPAKSVQPRLKN